MYRKLADVAADSNKQALKGIIIEMFSDWLESSLPYNRSNLVVVNSISLWEKSSWVHSVPSNQEANLGPTSERVQIILCYDLAVSDPEADSD